jgi:hypothetical protein
MSQSTVRHNCFREKTFHPPTYQSRQITSSCSERATVRRFSSERTTVRDNRFRKKTSHPPTSQSRQITISCSERTTVRDNRFRKKTSHLPISHIQYPQEPTHAHQRPKTRQPRNRLRTGPHRAHPHSVTLSQCHTGIGPPTLAPPGASLTTQQNGAGQGLSFALGGEILDEDGAFRRRRIW